VANQGTKEANKKIESLRQDGDEQAKKLKASLAEAQQRLYEKNAELKVAFDGINQLKKEIKTLEADNMKLKSALMKFENRRGSRKPQKVMTL
jgi:cell shape-determining protein MreC